MTDAELVARTLAGHTESFVGIVLRYYDDCLRFAVHTLGSRSDAEDVVQTTFIRALHGLGGYREQQTFRAWLFRILVNRCRTAQASRRRREERVTVDSDAVARSGAAARATREDGLALRAALATLDPDQREAFLLKHAEGLDYEAMSRITGAGESALKMRVKRARERMRRFLEEQGHA
jgi:RNA polymerase sigma-70 factor (ECF subfamily)